MWGSFLRKLTCLFVKVVNSSVTVTNKTGYSIEGFVLNAFRLSDHLETQSRAVCHGSREVLSCCKNEMEE